MFPVTVTIHTPAQLNAVLAAMKPELQASDFAHPAVGAAYVEVAQRVAAHDAAEAKPQKDAAAQTGKSAPKPEASAPTSPTAEEVKADAPEKKESTAQDPPAGEPLTYAQIGPMITSLVKAKGRDAAVALLKSFGVANGKELKPEQYADVAAKITAQLEA